MEERPGSSGIPVKRKTDPSNKMDSPTKTAEAVVHESSLDRNVTMENTTSKRPEDAAKQETLKTDSKLIEDNKVVEKLSSWLYYSILVDLTVSSFVTRLYKIEIPTWVW